MAGAGLIWDLIAKDGASPAFLRVASAADKAAASTARATKEMDASVARMGAVGATLTKHLTLPILGIAAVSVDQAAKFQKSMTLIQTAGGETAAKAAKISEGIKKVAVDTGTSLKDLSEGIYTVAKAGSKKWSAAEQLNVLKVAAQGAKAENVPLSVSVNALTSLMASYGVKAKDAVTVQNELIRASGLAKTTLTDFAGSLANVIPLASSLHISIPEVTGAIATMTQHGETAQRSTENLANLITALAGQNNVASQAMQQLGLHTLDLQKSLGSRGITGTLDLVERALAKSSKGGMVVVSAFKRAQLATSSLHTEIAAMPPAMAKLAQGFLNGTTTRSEYLKSIKGMGAQQYIMGRNFLTTANAALGFNNILKSGKGDVATTASMLQKMLGGVTGMRVALMLGGPSAQQFADNVKAVGKAALNAGSDVLGWNQTQDTLAVKMDKAKASLQVLAVEIGTALIPAVSKIVSGISSAVHWFSNLSGTQKEIAAWGVGILAALGPVLSLGSRLALIGRGIGTFAVGLGNTFARITTNATGMSVGVTRAVTGLTSALAGAGIGYAVGSLTKNAGTGTKVLSSLGAAAAGAAIGFGVGGPLGAAIGGIGAGLASLATQFLGQGHAADRGAAEARAALASEKQDVDDLFASLQAVNGAYNAQFKQSIIRKLGDSGSLGIAKKAGLNLPGLVDTIAGTGGRAGITQTGLQIDSAAATGKITLQQANALHNVLNSLAMSASDAEGKLLLENQAAGQGVLPHSALGVSVRKLRDAMAGSKNTLDTYTGAGMKNTAVIKQNLDNINANALAQLRHGKSVSAVASAYESQIGALDNNLHKLHFSRDEVQNLIGTYAKMPKSVITELVKRGVLPADIQAIIDRYHQVPSSQTTVFNADTAQAIANVQTLIDNIRGLQDKTVYIHSVIAHDAYSSNPRNSNSQPTSRANTQAIGTLGAFGQSTIPPNTRFTVGEAGWEGGMSDAHGRVSIFSNRDSKAMGFSAPVGYAKGTGKTYTVNGTMYASKLAAENAQHRLSASALSTVVSAIAALLAAARNTQSTASVIYDAARSLRSAAKDTSLTNRVFTQIAYYSSRRDSVNARLGVAAGSPTAYDRLAAARNAYNTDYSSVRDATKAFDITQLGVPVQVYTDQRAPAASAGSILTALTAVAVKAKTFAGLLKRLIREGMPQSIVQQLAAAGPAALDQAKALAAATPAQVAGFKAQVASLGLSGYTAGKSSADAYYLSGVNSAQGLVNGLLSQRNALNRAITQLADSMVYTLKRKLKIHSPSQVMFEHGAMTGEGFRLGVESKIDSVRQAGSKIGDSVRPPAAGQSVFGGGDVHMHIHGVEDPHEFARRVERRVIQRAQGFY